MDTLLYAHKGHLLKHLSLLLEDCRYGAPRTATSEQELIRTLEHCLPELLLVLHSPESLDATEAIRLVAKEFSIPAIMAASNVDYDLASRAASAGYASIIPLPASPSVLHASIAMAMEHGTRLSQLCKRVKDLESRLAERKVIEKGKGILMQKENINEEDAFRMMRKSSMSRRISMAKLAEELIKAYDRQGLP